MGEAKRRQVLDPTWGKHKLRTLERLERLIDQAIAFNSDSVWILTESLEAQQQLKDITAGRRFRLPIHIYGLTQTED